MKFLTVYADVHKRVDELVALANGSSRNAETVAVATHKLCATLEALKREMQTCEEAKYQETQNAIRSDALSRVIADERNTAFARIEALEAQLKAQAAISAPVLVQQSSAGPYESATISAMFVCDGVEIAARARSPAYRSGAIVKVALTAYALEPWVLVLHAVHDSQHWYRGTIGQDSYKFTDEACPLTPATQATLRRVAQAMFSV